MNEPFEPERDVENIGIKCVQTSHRKMAKVELGIGKFPAFGFFRNGNKEHFIEYKGDITDEAMILSWISDPESLEVANEIENVNGALLGHVIEAEDDVLVFFYESDDADLEEILGELEKIDGQLENEDVEFLMVDVSEEEEILSLSPRVATWLLCRCVL